MKPGDVVLAELPQVDGIAKMRPALVLGLLPPFDDCLVCGISTQLRHKTLEFDEIIYSEDDDFEQSGLVETSLVRLGFLGVLPRRTILGAIGSVSPARHRRLIRNLCMRLQERNDIIMSNDCKTVYK